MYQAENQTAIKKVQTQNNICYMTGFDNDLLMCKIHLVKLRIKSLILKSFNGDIKGYPF